MRFIFIAAILATSPAMATGVPFELSGNAITQCRGALPVYENGLRSRPLAVANEGTVASFVNCGFVYQSNSYGYDKVSWRLGNLGNAPLIVRCTAVAGREKDASYKTLAPVTVPANGIATVTVTQADMGGTGHLKRNMTIQCLLPPNGTLTDITSTFRHN